jgi:hypothetical protein
LLQNCCGTTSFHTLSGTWKSNLSGHPQTLHLCRCEGLIFSVSVIRAVMLPYRGKQHANHKALKIQQIADS